MQIQLQAAYILHARPYRETSLLLDILTPDYGRIHAVAKGAKRKSIGLLQPFIPLRLSWSGKRELKTLTSFESGGASQFLVSEWLYSAFYLNEILVRVLRCDDPHPNLFYFYESAIGNLSNQHALSPILREFEKHCLAEIGYALPLHKAKIDPEKNYYYDAHQGFSVISSPENFNQQTCFSGGVLHAIADNIYTDKIVGLAAKRLMRMALKPHLGDRPLQSRQFFSKSMLI